MKQWMASAEWEVLSDDDVGSIETVENENKRSFTNAEGFSILPGHDDAAKRIRFLIWAADLNLRAASNKMA